MDNNIFRYPGEIIYHFDVDRESVPLVQFIDTARATQEIIENFNGTLFDNKLKYELRVKTPEKGTLLEVLSVVIGVGGTVLAFFGTDIGKAFCRGLTGEEPAMLAEKIGARIRRAIIKLKVKVATNDLQVTTQTVNFVPDKELVENLSGQIDAEFIALILISFLEADLEHLKKNRYHSRKIPACI